MGRMWSGTMGDLLDGRIEPERKQGGKGGCIAIAVIVIGLIILAVWYFKFRR